jgi:putative oxidoreductase
MSARLSAYAPTFLAILRIMTALLFIEHGSQKLLGFPPGAPMPPREVFSMIWWAGVIELIPGAMVLLGLFTRPAAFIAAGEMAFAYWIGHFPRLPLPEGFFPTNNGGDAAILFCFVFLYLVFAGPGRWSVDGMLPNRDEEPDA